MLRKYIAILSLLCISIELEAQFFLDGYDKNTSPVEVCVGQTLIMVNDHDLVKEIFYFFDYTSPTEKSQEVSIGSNLSNFPHIYGEAGTYSVAVEGNDAADDGQRYVRSNYIRVLPIPTPQFVTRRCRDRVLSLTITDTVYDTYNINFGDGATTTASPGETVTHTYASTGTFSVNVQGIHILNNIASTPCNGGTGQQDVDIVPTINPNFSVVPEVPNSFCEGRVGISFDTSPEYTYQLEGTNEAGAEVVLATLAIDEATTGNFTLTQENVNTLTVPRNYRLRVTDVCSNVLVEEAITLPINITETYPIVLQNVNVTVQEAGVVVSWDASGYEAPDLNSYQIIQGDTPVGQVENTTTYTDEGTLNPSALTCYKVAYTTSCGFQTLDSPTVCTIVLSVEEELETLTFNWTPYINSEEETVTYALRQLNALGEVINSIELGGIFSHSLTSEDTENQVLRYRIEATTSSGFVSASNVVTIERPARLFLPSAFTPNGDQLNDTFLGKGVFISEYSLEIFNKNGLKVFTSNELQEGWDGRFNQQDQPVDTYLYVAEIKDASGRTQQYRGTLQLIR